VAQGRQIIEEGVEQGISSAETLYWFPAEKLQDEVTQSNVHLHHIMKSKHLTHIEDVRHSKC